MSTSQHRDEGLSLVQAIAVGVNTTSPAYSLAAILAPMALLVGFATPLVIVISFIPMALTSLAFLFLNRRDPDCGTTFSWVSRAIGPKSGFLAGWAVAAAGVLVLGSLAETAITYGFHTFGLESLASNRTIVIACSAVLIIAMTSLSIAGTDSSIGLQTVLAFAQVIILLVFAVAAALLAFRTSGLNLGSDWLNPFQNGVEPFVAALLLGVFAFWGWEASTNLAEECTRPSDAGKAGLISTVILLLTYVSVAIFVVMYLGENNFRPVGNSGLVIEDMSGPALGPLSVLILIAVCLSALASTQTTMVPGSRVVLSMARRGALPAALGLTHPRFKSPWVSLVVLGGIATTWYVLVSAISENAMLDTLSSLGILIAFYYSLTGIACAIYFRKHITESLKGFLMVGLGPILGSIGLAFMLVVGIRSVSDPSKSATGSPWLGLAPPLTIAIVIMAIGVLILGLRLLRKASFYSSPRETATHIQSPFPLAHEKPIAPGGVLIDCNASIHDIVQRIHQHRDVLATTDPVTMVFGIQPSGHSGEELDAARDALIDLAGHTFHEVESAMKPLGVRNPERYFAEADAHGSLQVAEAETQPSLVV